MKSVYEWGSGQVYLKKVYVCVKQTSDLANLEADAQKRKIQMECIAAEDLNDQILQQMQRKKEILFLSDQYSFSEKALQQGIAVLFVISEESDDKIGSIPYAVLDLKDIDLFYLDRVFRRYHGIPWEILQTKRCLIREVRVEDVPRMAEIYNAPSIKKYMEPLFMPIEREMAYTQDYIKNIYGFYEYGMWVIIEKSTGRIIGRAGLENYGMEEDQDDIVEIGYLIEDSLQHKGYATEVCEGILQYAKTELGFDEIYARIEDGNEASVEFCKKIGFQFQRQYGDNMGLYVRKL